MTVQKTPDDQEKALRLMREIHATGATPLSTDEAAEFLNRQIWFGQPQRITSGKRGRPPIRTQYDEARNRRISALHKLVHLPKIAHLGGAANRKASQPLRDRILPFYVDLVLTTNRRNLAKAIQLEMYRKWNRGGFSVPSIETIRRLVKVLKN